MRSLASSCPLPLPLRTRSWDRSRRSRDRGPHRLSLVYPYRSHPPSAGVTFPCFLPTPDLSLPLRRGDHPRLGFAHVVTLHPWSRAAHLPNELVLCYTLLNRPGASGYGQPKAGFTGSLRSAARSCLSAEEELGGGAHHLGAPHRVESELGVHGLDSLYGERLRLDLLLNQIPYRAHRAG